MLEFLWAKDWQPPSDPRVMAKKLGYYGGGAQQGAPVIPQWDAMKTDMSQAGQVLTTAHKSKASPLFPAGTLALHHQISMPDVVAESTRKFFY